MNSPESSRLVAYQRMVDTYHNESDRAAAILATSFLDNTLRKLLLNHMVDHPKVHDLFDGDRPLATFSSRITVAFGLGLLPHDRYHDLDLIRKIRNRFAHSEEAAVFDESPTRDWCAELWIAKQEGDPEFVARGIKYDPRTQFLLGVGISTLYLDHVLGQFRDSTRQRCG